MPIVTKNIAELENKKIDSYQNIAVVNDLDTMLIVNDGSLYSIDAQDLMTYIKDHPDLAAHYASKKELTEELNLKLNKSEKGIANGVTPLNENKKIPSEHILFGKTIGSSYQGSDGKTLEDNLTAHKSDINNPHKITATTIHLDNVDNTSDADKPVSIAAQNAIAAASSNSNEHSDISVSNHNLSETAHATKFNQKLDNTSANTFLKNVSYNSETGVFTFTKYDNTTITIDTPIEEVVTGGYYKEDTQELVLILVSGQEIKIPVTGLISEYTGETSASVQVVISADNKITANLVGGGVTRTLLSTELQNSFIELETLKHSHSNKSVIDGITSAKVSTWNNKSSFDGDYNKLTNKPIIPSAYKLPVATAAVLGGVKSGTGITVEANGNVSVVNDSHTHDGRYYTEGEINTKFNDTNSKLSNLEKYSSTYNINLNSGVNISITPFIKDLGFTLDNTIIELWNKVPTYSNIQNILTNSHESVFSKSLPVRTGGIISIIKEYIRGYIEFVDYRTNKKYIKSNIDNLWSDWSEIVSSNIIGNTNISNIGNGTLTGGLSKINSNLGGNVLITEGSGVNAKYYIQSGADAASKKLLGNISNLKYGKWDAISQFLYEVSWGASSISTVKSVLVPIGGTSVISATCPEAYDKFASGNLCGYPLKDLVGWSPSTSDSRWTGTNEESKIISATSTWNKGQPSYTTIKGHKYGIDICNISFKRADGLWRNRYVMAIVC